MSPAARARTWSPRAARRRSRARSERPAKPRAEPREEPCALCGAAHGASLPIFVKRLSASGRGRARESSCLTQEARACARCHARLLRLERAAAVIWAAYFVPGGLAVLGYWFSDLKPTDLPGWVFFVWVAATAALFLGLFLTDRGIRRSLRMDVAQRLACVSLPPSRVFRDRLVDRRIEVRPATER